MKFKVIKRSRSPDHDEAGSPTADLQFRLARIEDEPRLQAIRQAAFAQVFASFRTLLGNETYDLAQRREDESQGAMLAEFIAGHLRWTVYVAERCNALVGFVAIQTNAATHVGEIGLNAVDPSHAGRGVGSAMYEFVLDQWKRAGMQVAVVATGADPSHAAARRAYRKAGFEVEIPSVWMCRKL